MCGSEYKLYQDFSREVTINSLTHSSRQQTVTNGEKQSDMSWKHPFAYQKCAISQKLFSIINRPQKTQVTEP